LRFHLDFEPTLLKSQKYGKTDASMSKSLFPFKFAQVYKMTVLMFSLKNIEKSLNFVIFLRIYYPVDTPPTG